ncbi:MAG: HDOD domain-containing protein [Myxococcota bacterium]
MTHVPMAVPGPSELRMSLERHLDELPVLPTTLVAMMRLERSSESYFDDLVRLIEREPTYAARVLALANSAAVRGASRPTRIRDAVLRIGASTTTNLVVTLAVARVFVPTNAWERSLWVHAIHVATIARALAGRCELSPYKADDVYLCGLLHDIGRFILFHEAPAALRQVDEATWSSPADLLAAETAICGIDHAALGAKALEKWGLPAPIVAAVRDHHRATGTDPLAKVTALVRAVDRLDFHEVSPSHRTGEAAPPPDDDAALQRIRTVMPPWFPLRAEAVAPVVHAAHEEAAATLRELL